MTQQTCGRWVSGPSGEWWKVKNWANWVASHTPVLVWFSHFSLRVYNLHWWKSLTHINYHLLFMSIFLYRWWWLQAGTVFVNDDHSCTTNIIYVLSYSISVFSSRICSARVAVPLVSLHMLTHSIFELMARDQISFSGLIRDSQQQLLDPTIFHLCSWNFAAAVYSVYTYTWLLMISCSWSKSEHAYFCRKWQLYGDHWFWHTI